MQLWKKLLLCFVSLTGCSLIGIAVIMACSDEPDPYDYYTSFFHPDVQSQKDYGAFYFTDYRFTYTDDEPVSEAAINAAEWAGYLGQPVKAADVEAVMYNLDSAGKESAYRFLNQEGAAADSIASNAFLLALKSPEHMAALKYYRFAQQAEKLGQSSYNYWEPAPLDTAGLITTANEALQSATSESDPFLKLRYFYQAQKLNHYAQNYTAAKSIFDQHIAKTSTQSHIKGWALSLKAGEDRRLGDTVQAAYLFSKVFATYPERRVQAFRNYHYIDAPFDEVLKLADSPEEKANLYAIAGFAEDEIKTDNLEQVYSNAPSSPMVGVLLVREVNKLEQNYLTPALYNNSDKFYSDQAQVKTEKQSATAGSKWPLWLGIIVLITGAVLLIVAFKKQPVKPAFKVLGGALLLAGAAGMVWFFVSKPIDTPTEKSSLPKGSFYVALPDSIKNTYDAHIEKLRGFCETLTSEAKYSDAQIGTIVNAYLYFMQNKPDEGLAAIDNINGQKLTAKLDDQKQIIQLLLTAQRFKQLKPVDEASLLPALKWLDDKVAKGVKTKQDVYPPQPSNINQFAVTQRNFYTYVLAPAYLRQGDTAKAALAMLNSQNDNSTNYRYSMYREMPDFWYNYLHTDHLKQLIGWKNKRPAEAYMAFFTEGLKQVSDSSLYELLGTIQLREHRYQDALASFRTKKAKLNFARVPEEGFTGGDPFDVTINDYPKNASRGVNKLQFAEKMAQLEAKLKDDPKNADTYFKMATAMYNTSTYGNSWYMISYIWSSYDFGRNRLYYYDADYVKAASAKQYYLKARDLSTDAEFKATCTFMAAKCEQKEREAPSYENYETYDEQEKAYQKQLRSNSFFKEMQQYKNTKFYQRAVNECSYLGDFISNQ